MAVAMTSPEDTQRLRFLAIATSPVSRVEAITLARQMVVLWESHADHGRTPSSRRRAEAALSWWQCARETMLAVQAGESRRTA